MILRIWKMVNVCVFSQDIVDMDIEAIEEAMEAMDVAMAMEAIEVNMDITDMVQKCTYVHNYV